MRVIEILRKPTAIALAALVLTLSGCGGGDDDDAPRAEVAHALPNISLDGSPNQTRVGLLDPRRARTTVAREGRAIIAAFRARECGDAAPGFEKMMRRQIADGMRVPDGITLYDAGVGTYTSSRCGAPALARAIGVYGYKRGTYILPFFKGKSTKKVVVK